MHDGDTAVAKIREATAEIREEGEGWRGRVKPTPSLRRSSDRCVRGD
jgi:hypothetical protein